jgi:hypothetical protein
MQAQQAPNQSWSMLHLSTHTSTTDCCCMMSCRWWSCRPSRDPPADESPDTTQQDTTQTAGSTDTASELITSLSTSPSPAPSPSPMVGSDSSSSGSSGGALPAPECPHQLNGSAVVIRINAGMLTDPAWYMPLVIAAVPVARSSAGQACRLHRHTAQCSCDEQCSLCKRSNRSEHPAIPGCALRLCYLVL